MILRRNAFSLLELIIVVMLISVSYMLIFSSMQKSSSEAKALSPLTLKSILLDQNLSSTEAEFFCLNKCKVCFLHQYGETVQYEGKLDLEKLVVYKIDADDNSYKVDFGRLEDHPVCLRFSLHTNGSSSQMIIEKDRRFYYLPTYFGSPIETDSLSEAQKLWIEPTKILLNSGEYY